MAFSTLFSFFWIAFFVQERSSEKKKGPVKSLAKTCSYLKRFCTSPVLRPFALFLLTQRIGWSPFDILFQTLIIQEDGTWT